MPFTKILGEYCDRELNHKVELIVAGAGPQKDELLGLSFNNLNIDYRGQCNKEQLTECYKDADVCVFPTRVDEWGLVPMESWASGVPVLGSNYAQSIEAVGKNGVNGWFFDVHDDKEVVAQIATALNASSETLQAMSQECRESVEAFTPESSANLLCAAVEQIGSMINTQPVAKVNASLENPNAETVTQTTATKPPNRRLATISLDLDNKWSYLKSHDNPAWESFPSYLNAVVPTILSVLDDLDMKITFFVVGQDAVIPENFDAIKMIADHGHEIANHSFHHDTCLQLYSPEQLECEFEMSERAIENLVGQKMQGFRGPGFSLSDQTLKLLSRRGYLYDCTTFPTFLAPVARAYYFMTGSFSRSQKKEPSGPVRQVHGRICA